MSKKLSPLKALEIIKEKWVNVEFLLNCNSLEEYNSSCSYYGMTDRCLTQKEFDLLKEVLL